MKHIWLFVFVFFMVFNTNGRNLVSSQNKDIVSNFKHLSPERLLDTANYYFHKRSSDTALVCYGMIINSFQENTTIEHQKRVVEALCKSALIYCNIYDYRKGYELFIRALRLGELINYTDFQIGTLLNIGNIYFRFNDYNQAKLYYSEGLKLAQDSMLIIAILNNLGGAELKLNNYNEAFALLNQAKQISKRYGNASLCNIYNILATYYKNIHQYDSAEYFYRLSLYEVENQDNRTRHRTRNQAGYLSEFGGFFFHIKKLDSAFFYVERSNEIALNNNYLEVLSRNYLLLSQMEKARGNPKFALNYFEKHTLLKDSISGTSVFSGIHQMSVSNLNEQINRFAVDYQIKKRTIRYQNIGMGVLFLICVILLIVFFQRRALDSAYQTLIQKNVEIIQFQSHSSQNHLEKYGKNKLKDEAQNELLSRVFTVMEDTPTICDVEFSLNKLSELVQSNSHYVSQVINGVVKKNFRSFLNDYRIREAQRLFSEPDASKYTIETVAYMSGFKSRTTFINAFKEVTGVSPNLYFKSVVNQKSETESS